MGARNACCGGLGEKRGIRELYGNAGRVGGSTISISEQRSAKGEEEGQVVLVPHILSSCLWFSLCLWKRFEMALLEGGKGGGKGGRGG